MEFPDHYEQDVLFFFDGHPTELSLFRALAGAMDAALPPARLRVQKSQISFYNRHLFAAASLPVRRRRDWPKECLVVTIGLGRPLDSPRVAVAVEPYPGRWTHHVLVSRAEEIDGELLAWLEEAYEFAQTK